MYSPRCIPISDTPLQLDCQPPCLKTSFKFSNYEQQLNLNILTSKPRSSFLATSSSFSINARAMPFFRCSGRTSNFSTMPRKGPVSANGIPSITYPASLNSPVLGFGAICMRMWRWPVSTSLHRSSHQDVMTSSRKGGRKVAIVYGGDVIHDL